MTRPDDAAFARPHAGGFSPQAGLTKREYFAALALQGLIASIDRTLEHPTFSESVVIVEPGYGDGDLEQMLAVNAVEYADALIAALNHKGGAL